MIIIMIYYLLMSVVLFFIQSRLWSVDWYFYINHIYYSLPVAFLVLFNLQCFYAAGLVWWPERHVKCMAIRVPKSFLLGIGLS